MDATQQAALQALAGRLLTTDEVTLAAARADQDLAASLSVGLVQTVPTRIGPGAVLTALGAVSGAALLDAMTALAATVSPIKWGLALLNAGTFDVGNPVSIGMINLLVTGGTIGSVTIPAGTVTQETATTLLALAVVPAPIATAQVSAILNGP